MNKYFYVIQFRRVVLILIIFLVTSRSYSQIIISGVIEDARKKAIPSASITLTSLHNNIILAFAISNNQGKYTIKYNGNELKDTFLLHVRAINFSSSVIQVKDNLREVNFLVADTITKLPDITVKNSQPLLKVQGDTISYDVVAFSTPQDRFIGDIIKRLPGVEMDRNGQITYQGKPITNFYIDGDDLLNDKYNIATRSIPNGMVDKVQILENHQPIRVLKGVITSDKPAMNIVLNDSARLNVIGAGEIAQGNQGSYEGAMNTMLFRKRVKFINYFKLNNIGDDLSEDIISHLTQESGNKPTGELISLRNLGNPNLAKHRYLFNNTGVLNGNNLLKLKNNAVLKINSYYLYDKQYHQYENIVTLYLPSDTIPYIETQTTLQKTNIFRTQFNVNVNTTNYYLDNTTVIENTSKNALAALATNVNTNISQQSIATTTTIYNQVIYKKRLSNNHALEGYSYLGNTNNPQALTIAPSLYADLINRGVPSKQSLQHIDAPLFFTNNYFRYYSTNQKLLQSYKVGYIMQMQQLNSALYSLQTDATTKLASDSFANQLSWQHSKLYFESNIDWVSKQWQIGVTIPVNYEVFDYNDKLRKPSKHYLNFFPFSPSLRAKFKVDKESFISADYQYANLFGGVANVYEGFILSNYRTFSATDGNLSISKSNIGSVNYSFRNAAKLLFVNAGSIFSIYEKNVMPTSTLSDTLSLVTSRSVNNNDAKSFVFYLAINKYIFKWRTTISLKTSWQQSIASQVQNKNLLQFQSNNTAYSISVRSRINSWLNTDYNCAYITYKNQQLNGIRSASANVLHAKQLQQQLQINMTVSDNLYLKLAGENYYTKSPGVAANNIYFADASFIWKINKLKSDIEFFFKNMLGNESYSIVGISENSINKSVYSIRPRMILLKYTFHF